jgi:hypothetical protein
MMNCLATVFGHGIMIRICDPPVQASGETDPTALNLEKDRMIFAAVKISESLTAEKSAALASFADLLTNLIEVRGRVGRCGTVIPERYNGRIGVFDADLIGLRVGQLITIGIKLLRLFHVPDVLNCDDRCLASWMGRNASFMANAGSFLSMVHALNFAYAVCSAVGWMDEFSYSEQTALALSVFLGHCFPQIHPNFRYERLLSQCINTETSQRAVTRISTMLVLLGDDSCDLLATTPESLLMGLIELWIHGHSMVCGRSIAYFHVIQRRLSIEDMFHRTVARHFVEEGSLCSLYMTPVALFSQWVARFMNQPIDALIRKGKGVVTDIATELVDYSNACACLNDYVRGMLKYLSEQSARAIPERRTEKVSADVADLLPLSAASKR